MLKRIFILNIVSHLFCVCAGFAQSPLLPPDHWSYRVFERFIIKDAIDTVQFHSYPWQRRDGAQLLTRLQQDTRNDRLTDVEHRLLQRLWTDP